MLRIDRSQRRRGPQTLPGRQVRRGGDRFPYAADERRGTDPADPGAGTECADHSAVGFCGASGPHGAEHRGGCRAHQERQRAGPVDAHSEAPGEPDGAQAAGLAESTSGAARGDRQIKKIRHTGSVLLSAGVLISVFLALAAAAGAATPAPRRATAAAKPSVSPKASPTVRRWMKSMTLRDEVAQLIFIAFHGTAPHSRSREYRKFMAQIRDTKVGGLILVNWSNGRVMQKAEPYAVAAFLNRMQRLAKTPLMVSGDFERGVSMRVEGTTVFPHAMAFGAAGNPAYSRYEGEVTAREARALGVHWIYYPVADVNNNPDNPIINIRSFGENPEAVAAQVKAFIEGAHSDKKNYALTTAKHFPGHGDTAVDSHLNMPTITVDRDRLEHVELVPFKAAIASGVDAVMTAHIEVPALSPPGIPSTLSAAILTDLLKKELGFHGIVVTDALEMAGIVKSFSTGDAAVRALEAGADVLLMPTDPEAVVRAVTAAVGSGRIGRRRIQESVVKILAAKERVGLDRKRFVDLESIGDVVDSAERNEKATRDG